MKAIELTETPAVARRGEQRGAVVFVVMMAILVITSTGVWALYSAGLTSRASGRHRSAAQTVHMAEMGLLVGTGYFSVPGYADANYSQATRNPDACHSVAAGEFCKSMYMEDIDTTIQIETANMGAAYTILETATAEGSLGAIASPNPGSTQGHFVLEMSNPKPVLVAGSDVSSSGYQQVTLTSYGLVRPYAANLCSASENAAANELSVRAHAIIGPLTP